jgi:hypothetical protein
VVDVEAEGVILAGVVELAVARTLTLDAGLELARELALVLVLVRVRGRGPVPT